MCFSFYGFPDWYYSVKYPHVGSRDLAQNVMSKLENAGIEYAPVERGLDHGAWLPLLVGKNIITKRPGISSKKNVSI